MVRHKSLTRSLTYPGQIQSCLVLLLCLFVNAQIDAAPTLHEAKVAIKLKDYHKAHKLFAQLSKNGDKEAQYQLAVLYRNGQGIQKNYTLARKWFYRSARQGHIKAQYNMGVIYHKGLGVKPDSGLAKKWYQLAAEKQYRPAVSQLEKLSHPDQQTYSDLNTSERFRLIRSAIKNSDTELVLRLLDGDVDREDKTGETALILAAQEGETGIIRSLLEAGAAINKVDNNRMNALHHAAIKGTTAAAKLLLDEKIDYAKTDMNDYTALMYAAKNGQRDIVSYMLINKKYTSMNGKNKQGQTAYSLASLRDHKEIRQLLVKYGARPLRDKTGDSHELQLSAKNKQIQYNKWTPLMVAAWRGNTGDIRRILGKYRGIINKQDPEGYTALMLAAQQGHVETVKLLLRYKPKPDLKTESGMTALAIATENGKTGIVRLLLDNSANPNTINANGDSVLMLACRHGNRDIVKLLIENKANINQANKHNGYKAIEYSIINGYAEIMDLLLDSGASVPRTIIEHKSLLWHAASNNHGEILKSLLRRNNNAITNKRSLSESLLIASQKGYLDIARLICESKTGIDVNISDELGNSPLLFAASKGHYKTTQYLLNKHAEVNTKDKYGNTPLIMAAANGHTAIVKLLLAKGANSKIRNKDRFNAKDMAINSGNKSIAMLIEKY